MTDNMKGAVLMTFAMAAFAVEDALIKLTSQSLGPGFVIVVIGVFGGLGFGIFARRQGVDLLGPALWSKPVLARNGFEAIATVSFVTALMLAPLSIATAIIQATPLVVTLGAALVFKETVGWRRWSAILVGLFGVLLILRPWTESFDPTALWAVSGMLFLALRDLATRAVPKDVPSSALATWGLMALIPVGAAMMIIDGFTPHLGAIELVALVGMLITGMIAYYAIIEAMRIGEVAVVTPFRYTRLLFGLTVAIVIFEERPDTLTYVGAAIILGAGLYTLWREANRT